MKTYNDPLYVSYEQLTVTYGMYSLILNKRLLDQQLCWENLDAIKDTHYLKLAIYDMIQETEDAKLLKDLAEDITECEFELQRLWKFSENHNFHRFWDTPKCSCPKLDNEDAYPTGHYTVNLSCVLHGKD